MKFYKVNWLLYIILLVCSLVIIFSTLFVPMNNTWFTIVTGIGCGAFASVVIAFLIEIKTVNDQNKHSQITINQVFDHFDSNLQIELELGPLLDYAYQNDTDVEKVYSLKDIINIVDKIRPYAVRAFIDVIVDIVADISPETILLCGKEEKHVKIYSAYSSCRKVCAQQKRFLSFYKDEKSKNTAAHSSLKLILSAIDKVFEARGVDIEFRIFEDEKPNVIAYRKDINSRRNSNVSFKSQ